MSYTDEHRKMKPVLDLAEKLSIATNPAPEALYDKLNSGFNVWCTPEDNPGGVWKDVTDKMIVGAFAKHCAFLGSCYWGWNGGKITSLQINTTAYHLKDHHPDFKTRYRSSIKNTAVNRDDDIEWLIEKIQLLFQQAGVTMPPIILAA